MNSSGHWRGPWLLGVVVLVAAGLNVLANLIVPDPLHPVVNPGVAVALVLLAQAAGITRAEMGLARVTAGAGVRLGLGAAAIVFTVVVLAAVVPASGELLAGSATATGASELITAVFVQIPLAVALPEELVFRGVLLAVFAQRVGTRRAVVASSVLFGLWHVLPTLDRDNAFSGGVGEVVVAVAATTVAGMVFAGLRLRSRSILAPLVAHWSVNAAGLLGAVAAARLHS